MNRPYADIESENWVMHNNSLCQEEMNYMYDKSMEECRASGVYWKRASEHKDWKWIIMDDSWSRYCVWKGHADNCDPAKFGLNIEYNSGPGMLEIMENFVSSISTERCARGKREC